MNFIYRVRQFWQLLTAQPLSTESWQEVKALLNPGELALFCRFSTADQQHSYRVMCTLREAGYEEHPLLAAALLHDVGKTNVRLWWWERVLGTVVEALFPSYVQAWGQGKARGWRRAFVIRQQHSTWGAELAQEAGSMPLTVALIRHHQDKGEVALDDRARELLQALQWADNRH